MSSAICQNFVQNAWKKELCSNCFKSKDEHNLPGKLKPLQLNLRKHVKGIIKDTENFRPKRSVCFTSELSKVIGFGGEDWSSDHEDEMTASIEDEGFEIEEEENEEDDEKELQKLTKANTDFNTNSLNENTEVKKSYTQLMLGKPLVDSEGRKQTLLVSVTPFGQDSLVSPTRKFSKPISHIPIAKNNKDSLAETKTNVILTAYSKSNDTTDKEEKSLLDEITETLENSKNPIKIISRKKIQKDVVLSIAKPDANKENLDCDKTNNKNIEHVNDNEEKESKLIKSNIPERKNGLTRTTVIKRDQEKPTVYQTSTAKIELLNTKNLNLSNSKENLTNKIIKSELKINNKTDFNDKKDEDTKKVATTECINVSLASSKFIKEEILNNAEENNNNKLKIKNEPILNGLNVEESPELKRTETKVLGLPPQVPKYQNLLFTQSREQAGEPDGRADPDIINEPPALPLTPPPNLEMQTSFLHNHNTPQIYDKPKVPSKPATVLIRKPVTITHNHVETQNHVLTTFAVDLKATEEKMNLVKQDSNGSDVNRVVNTNKRKAPKPPHIDDVPTVYTRNSAGPINFDSPVVREKEKRERASSCSPKMRNIVNENPQGDTNLNNSSNMPEPAPRRSLSLSTDSLVSTCGDEKRKEKSKGRFSLKKFLRMGSNKDIQKMQTETIKNENYNELIPQPKPRLVIVHPLDLNGAKVEVVPKSVIGDEHNECAVNNISSCVLKAKEIYSQKQTKPPPPPRNIDEWNRASKPNLPHPPKSAEIINKQKQLIRNINNNRKVDSVYANIGEVRSAICPNKPQRTASMREREAQQQRKIVDSYGSVAVRGKDSNENVYDYINSARSSSPECDSSPDKNSPTSSKNDRLQNSLNKQRSESSVDVSGDYFKYQNIPRSMSLTYCGSETESEIYSPYSFYGSESEITEDDHDWAAPSNRTHKLRSRKGRSIVHKNLEDNYGAVVVANHEALAQVLENIQQTTSIQPALRGLKMSSNLRWTDFSIKGTIAPSIVGHRAFHQALWGVQHVTLVISAGSVSTSPTSLGTFNLVPVTEFSDLIPVRYLTPDESDVDKNIQATIAVFPWMQVNTIQSFGETLKSKISQNHEDVWKDGSFILLQLVNALKTLQAQGIEELQLSLNSFVLTRDMDKDTHYRLSVLQGLGEEITHKKEDKYGSLCMCASKALTELLPSSKITPLIQSLLNTERAVSLTQVKSILEFSLWGPSDVALGTTIRERELALQRWLDLQRATVLHGLVCTRVQLTVYEECHLLFLVRSNPRMMCDASLLLESSNIQQAHNNK